MVVTSFIGPHLKCPAKAPMLVATVGITVVKSISETVTPGDSEYAMKVSFNKEFCQ
jgi:hypothetical protein